MTDPATDVSTSEAPPPPPPVNMEDLWHLDADTSTLDRTGQQWRAYARAARESAQLVDDRGDRLYADQWAGDVADTYTEHRRKLTRDIRSAADLADTMGDELERVSAELTFAQRDLDDCIARASREVGVATTGPGMVVFYPEDENDVRCVEDCVREAEQIRNRLDEALLGSMAAMERTRGDWQTMASALDAVSNGTVEPFTMPPEVAGTFVIFDGNDVIINTGKGNDKVAVTVDPNTGEQIVTVNGVTNRYPADANITVRAGEGNDEINVEPGVKVHMTLLGGKGDDIIHGGGGDDTILGLDGKDKLYGGEGSDRISGGAGRDYIDGYSGDDILDGGRGNDTLYGLSGNDQLSGGEGQDYLEGGTGDDKLFGGAGNDILSGGRDNDTLYGGAGDDKMYGGFGRTTSRAAAAATRPTARTTTPTSATRRSSTSSSPMSAASSRSKGRRSSWSGSRPTSTSCARPRAARRCSPRWRPSTTRAGSSRTR